MALKAKAVHGTSIGVACRALCISETSYRYKAKLSYDNVLIADWLIRLTNNQRNWGLGLCYLCLRTCQRIPAQPPAGLSYLSDVGAELAYQAREALRSREA